MKPITPKHPLVAENRSTSPSNRFLRWVPFSRNWTRLSTLGLHSPTWASAMALSAMLIGEGNTSRFVWQDAEIIGNLSPSHPNSSDRGNRMRAVEPNELEELSEDADADSHSRR